MVYTKEDFNSRIGAVTKKSARRGKNAFVTRIDNNGVFVVKAKPARMRPPVKGAAIMVFSLFCFKAFLLSANGPQAYEDRLSLLQNGTFVEAMGARALAIDPVTQFIADQVGPLFR